MHFTYTYVSHEIEKFQKYSDFIFHHVWCRARGPFTSNKFAQFPELHTIFTNLEKDPGQWATFFVQSVKEIYFEFSKLGKAQKREFKRWYRINNNVINLCKNTDKTPVKYKDIAISYPKISALLKKFYDRLYGSTSPFILEEFGNIQKLRISHYQDFIIENFGGHEGICPFCGLNSIKGNDHSKLEAYDHFIPKGQYPFNSINFKNLAPMCHECNSSYKLEENPLLNIDPLTRIGSRRRAFYPYSQDNWEITINVTLQNPDINNLKKEEIIIDAHCDGRLDEVESWLEVFGIEERYKAKILGNHTGKKWYSDLFDGFENAKRILKKPDMTKEDWIALKMTDYDSAPYSDSAFLKKPFYLECARLGIA